MSLSPREVALSFGVTTQTVRNWAIEERIISSSLGNGTLRIVRQSAVEFYHNGMAAQKDACPVQCPPADNGNSKHKPFTQNRLRLGPEILKGE
ncbi:MAG: hypothetical protein MZV70_64095 [Desulfobacterales bacterium]|nr:hypothetical protein [Desulfobacterales bacterium]